VDLFYKVHLVQDLKYLLHFHLVIVKDEYADDSMYHSIYHGINLVNLY
jgi:hypothetical protein